MVVLACCITARQYGEVVFRQLADGALFAVQVQILLSITRVALQV